MLLTVNSLIPSANLVLDPALKPPGDLQAKLLRQIILSGLGDHVAWLVMKLFFTPTFILFFSASTVHFVYSVISF